MEIAIQNLAQKKVGTHRLNEAVFGCSYRSDILARVVRWQLAKRQAGTHASKGISDISGTTRKPHKQKGTGRARAGSVKGPIWRGGGVTFAAKPQDHSQKVNRKMYRGALASILSELVRQERLVVVNDFAVETPKTKELVAKLKGLELKDVLIVTPEVDENLFLSARNLYKVDVRDVQGIDPVSLVGFEKVLMTASAVKQIEEMLG